MATLREVANLAGVSTATVSHVINGTKVVGAATRVRVELAIAQLEYVPEAVGRLLAQKRQQTRISSPQLGPRGRGNGTSRRQNANRDAPLPGSSGRQDPAVRETIISSGDNARIMLRIIRASQPISRVALARCLEVNRSTVTEIVKPLIASGVLREGRPEQTRAGRRGRPPIGLTLCDNVALLMGVNIGVRHTQVGAATGDGLLLAEESFATSADSQTTLMRISSIVGRLQESLSERTLVAIGVSVPGPTDAGRKELLFAPHLGWRDVPVGETLSHHWKKNSDNGVPVIVENDATAAALYEQRRRLRNRTGIERDDFVLVRAGTGIGVGMVVGGEVYRGTGKDCGLLGEFGHMTVVAGGRLCACGNRGCWELYASATSATSLYAGERAGSRGERQVRFVEIVARAEAGEPRARATLERVGKYLGIGIGNLITGLGVSRVVVSGRLVHGWKFVEYAVREAVAGTMAGRLSQWSVERGEATGSGLGGALEVAVEHYLTRLARSTRVAA